MMLQPHLSMFWWSPYRVHSANMMFCCTFRCCMYDHLIKACLQWFTNIHQPLHLEFIWLLHVYTGKIQCYYRMRQQILSKLSALPCTPLCPPYLLFSKFSFTEDTHQADDWCSQAPESIVSMTQRACAMNTTPESSLSLSRLQIVFQWLCSILSNRQSMRNAV